MPTLLELSDDMRALDDLLTDCGGDISDPEIAALVDRRTKRLEENFDDKADSYAALITELDRRADVRKAEADRMAKRAAIDRKNAQWLRWTMLSVMKRNGIGKIETNRFRLSVANNGGKVPLVLGDDVPEAWMLPSVSPGVDKDRIRGALERGQKLPFAEFGERGQRLNIK